MPAATVSARLETEEMELLDSLAHLSGLERASLIRTILKKGLDELRLELAINQYRDEKVTLSRAAEIAGLSLWDLIARMKPLALDLPIDDHDLQQDLRAFDRST
jgi:predicted HTH domain antitoxin